MKKLLLVFFLLFSSIISSFATHIVGGEISLEYLSGTTYRLTLNMYRDMAGSDLLGSQVVRIFRLSDHSQVEEIVVPRISFDQVQYTNPVCATAVGAVLTEIHTYQIDINLDPTIYNDNTGYYISSQRCCRNGTIDNIVSK